MREPLTSDEADRLRQAAETGAEKYVVWTLLDCGLRVAELCALDRTAVDWQDGTLRIIGKGNKRRVVPMPARTRDLVERVLTIEDRPPLTIRTVQRIVRRVADRARITRLCSPHVLRHTYAVQCMQRGLSLPSLQRLLGHVRLTTTAGYLRVSNSEAINEFRRTWEARTR